MNFVVVGEHIAIERVQGGIVDVRLQDALTQIVEDDDLDRPAQPTKRFLVQLGPAPGTRFEPQEPDALAAVAQGEDEEPCAAVLARLRMPDHRPRAVVGLAFLPRGRDDHRVRLGQALAAELPHEAPDAGVPGGEAVLIDEVPPDGHRLAPAFEGEVDQFAVRLAGTGPGRPAGRRRPGRQPRGTRQSPAKVGGHLTGRFCRVGGHRTGRLWWRRPALPGRADRDPGGLEVGARRLATDAGRPFDAAERPAEPAQSENLLPLIVSQDVGHPGGEPHRSRRVNVLGRRYLTGRFSSVHDWPVLTVHRGRGRPFGLPDRPGLHGRVPAGCPKDPPDGLQQGDLGVRCHQ
jgi:hypothetical protein